MESSQYINDSSAIILNPLLALPDVQVGLAQLLLCLSFFICLFFPKETFFKGHPTNSKLIVNSYGQLTKVSPSKPHFFSGVY